MFNMQKIGKKISSLRKQKNMTQMELADVLGISYQAVSNWERGNSMPDISKLPELAKIFEISLDELLGENAASIEAAIDNSIAERIENNDVSEEEISNVLPLMKPEQIRGIVKNTNVGSPYITDFLPFMDEGDVKELALKAMERGEGAEEYLPFMDERDVKELALKAIERGEGADAYLPFMDEGDVKELALKAMERGEGVEKYLPFMDEEDVKEIALFVLENRNNKLKP